MESLIIHPTTPTQLTVLEGILREMKIKFEKLTESKVSPYDPEFVAKIKRGEQAAKEGNGMKVNMENLWK